MDAKLEKRGTFAEVKEQLALQAEAASERLLGELRAAQASADEGLQAIAGKLRGLEERLMEFCDIQVKEVRSYCAALTYGLVDKISLLELSTGSLKDRLAQMERRLHDGSVPTPAVDLGEASAQHCPAALEVRDYVERVFADLRGQISAVERSLRYHSSAGASACTGPLLSYKAPVQESRDEDTQEQLRSLLAQLQQVASELRARAPAAAGAGRPSSAGPTATARGSAAPGVLMSVRSTAALPVGTERSNAAAFAPPGSARRMLMPVLSTASLPGRMYPLQRYASVQSFSPPSATGGIFGDPRT